MSQHIFIPVRRLAWVKVTFGSWKADKISTKILSTKINLKVFQKIQPFTVSFLYYISSFRGNLLNEIKNGWALNFSSQDSNATFQVTVPIHKCDQIPEYRHRGGSIFNSRSKLWVLVPTYLKWIQKSIKKDII